MFTLDRNAQDANVLINLMHVSRLYLCGDLPAYEFVVPDHVRTEITNVDQRDTLDAAIAQGVFRIASITNLVTIDLYATLATHLGRGESACLALAVEQGAMVASDEMKRFRREAIHYIGERRIIGTKDVYVLAITAGLLTIEQADADKLTLELHRFKMNFSSFRDILA